MPSAVTSLQHVPFSDTDNIITAIEKDGAVIATDYTDLETLHKVNTEMETWLLKENVTKKSYCITETGRCPRLIGRSPTAREQWLTRPQLTSVLNYFLCKTTTSFRDDERQTHTTYPTLTLSITLDILPGTKGQPLHRDDAQYQVEHRDQTQSGYRRESDVMMGVLCPGVETAIENGATLIIPGSHLWDDNRAPSRDEVVYATMQPGEALIFLSSTFHAGGANVTEDRKRPTHSMFFCRGSLRQEENQYLAYTAKEVLSWSEKVHQLAGYYMSPPNLGYVDFVAPVQFLQGYGALVE